jgi:hypothetical protein
MSLLKPNESVMTGIAEAAIVYGVYAHNMPTSANVRANPLPNDQTLETVRKESAMECAGIIGLVFLLTRDWNSLIISGITLGAVDMWMKHHNATDPASNKATPAAVPGQVQPDQESSYTPVPAQQYSSEDATDWAA